MAWHKPFKFLFHILDNSLKNTNIKMFRDIMNVEHMLVIVYLKETYCNQTNLCK